MINKETGERAVLVGKYWRATIWAGKRKEEHYITVKTLYIVCDLQMSILDRPFMDKDVWAKLMYMADGKLLDKLLMLFYSPIPCGKKLVELIPFENKKILLKELYERGFISDISIARELDVYVKEFYGKENYIHLFSDMGNGYNGIRPTQIIIDDNI